MRPYSHSPWKSIMLHAAFLKITTQNSGWVIETRKSRTSTIAVYVSKNHFLVDINGYYSRLHKVNTDAKIYKFMVTVVTSHV